MVRGIVISLLVLALSAVVVDVAFAEETRVIGATAARKDNVLSVSFEVANAFTEDMENAIMSGVPHTFTYFFEIYRAIDAWPDLRIYHWQVQRTIRYDTLKKTFSVQTDQSERTRHTSDFAEAKRWMVRFDNYPVGVVQQLDSKFKHFVRVKAKLDPMNWPLFLDKIFFFMNLWSFETPWQRIDLPLEPENVDAP